MEICLCSFTITMTVEELTTAYSSTCFDFFWHPRAPSPTRAYPNTHTNIHTCITTQHTHTKHIPHTHTHMIHSHTPYTHINTHHTGTPRERIHVKRVLHWLATDSEPKEGRGWAVVDTRRS